MPVAWAVQQFITTANSAIDGEQYTSIPAKILLMERPATIETERLVLFALLPEDLEAGSGRMDNLLKDHRCPLCFRVSYAQF
jgi:hypothetical protein